MDFFAAFWLFLAFFVGIGFAACLNWLIHRRALSIVRGQAGVKGRAAQAEQENDLMQLISEVALAFKEGKEAGEKPIDTAKRVLPGVALKHPATAMKFGKKLLKEFGGTDLEGLL